MTFMTRLPLSHLSAHDAADLPLSAVYFPLAGIAVALVGAFVFALSTRLWSNAIAVLLSMAAMISATGAFHEDALADALDGFGGGWTRDRVLDIMKDSRVGSYAVVGVTLVLALKFAALLEISRAGTGTVVRALITGHVLARWSSLPLAARLPYVRPSDDNARASAGRPFSRGVTTARLAAGTAIAALAVIGALGASASAVVAGGASLAVTGLAASYFSRRIGGITGDALGAANQIVELVVYLTLAARAM
jgi:adenosylcobinamide-GDP ribazoletransferase